MKKLYVFFLSLLSSTIGTTAVAQSVQLNNNGNLSGIPFNGKLVLTSDLDSTFWTSDGTPAGTKKLTDVKSGSTSYAILNNKIYFNGMDSQHGSELWVTDGTPSGTAIVQDIWPGADSSKPDDFVTYLGKLYFTAYTPGTGRELYQYDGTGSAMAITDINVGSNSSFDAPLFYVLNNILFFDAINSTGTSLYGFNGLTVTKLLDFPTGYGISGYSYIGNELFFTLNNGTNGMRIYKTSGSSAASLVQAFSGAVSGYTPPQLVSWNNTIFFTVAAIGVDFELWTTNGTTTQMLKDINPGGNGSTPLIMNSVILNNKLVFSASTDDSGAELWVTDGTAAGTHMLIDLNTADGEGSDPVLWPVGRSVENIQSELNNADIFNRTGNFGGYIFFTATSGSNGTELYKTNGTPEGTSLVKDINSGIGDGADASYLYTTAGVLFTGNDGAGGFEPWISDGTAAGTKGLTDIAPGGDAHPEFLFIWNGNVYLNADNGDGGIDGLYDFYKLMGPYSPLPVTLSAFTVTPQSSNVLLKWITSAETNTADFEVQRSHDGIHFSSIGTVAASGTSTTVRHYSFADEDAYRQHTEILYYRLNTIDRDGKSALSTVRKVRIESKRLTFDIYPNPAQSVLNIQLPAGSVHPIEILDIKGSVVMRKAAEQKENSLVQLDISALPSGTYFIKVTDDRLNRTHKFIKQ